MTRALLDRLERVFDHSPATRTHAGAANWPDGANPPANSDDFGAAIGDVHTIIPHFTEGWPSRAKVNGFVTRYTTRNYGEDANGAVVPCGNCTGQTVAAAGCTCKWGIGTQYYISGDGTGFRIIDTPRVTFHAGYINTWSMGIELGNLGTVSPPPRSWIQANRDRATQANDDIPGARLWLRHLPERPGEVIAAWWTTATFAGPQREPVGADRMLFNEAHYRTLALLCRYAAEENRVPRNVPVLPHVRRQHMQDAAAVPSFRRIILADPAFDDLVAALAPFNITAAELQPANLATLQARYTAPAAQHAATARIRAHNLVWRALIRNYRGFHGHGYSGTISRLGSDHDCPGPVFDWHRFAREVWDWWWVPFDVDATTGSTSTPRRAYQNPVLATPLHEYYFDENVAARRARARFGIHGATESPSTYTMDPDSPVYAIANGELVAARIPPPAAGQASTAFALVRCEVFHAPHPLSRPIPIGSPMFPFFVTPLPGAIDYSLEPTYVYLLYMHLGRQGGIDLANVSADNPDWLNRVIIRKKEYDLGTAFVANSVANGVPVAAWNSNPPGSVPRASLSESWAIDQAYYDPFLDWLRAGDVALAPPRTLATPIRILLGDYLGKAGVCSTAGGTNQHGVRIEAFSPLPLPGFSYAVTTDWSPPAGQVNDPALFYQSEWARTPTAAEAASMRSHGFDPATPSFWNDVALNTAWADPDLPAHAWLPQNGWVWHYRALDVARWLNDLTWKHEREKYGSPAAAALAQPRSRRV